MANFTKKAMAARKTVHAHFDGEQILGDEPLPLKEDDELLVTLLENAGAESPMRPIRGLIGEEMRKLIGIVSRGGNSFQDTEKLSL